MNKIKTILLVTVLAFLSGCSSWDTIMKDDPEVGGSENEQETMVCRIPLEVNRPDSIQWINPRFYVLNKEKMRKIVNGEADDMPDVYIALTAKGYENLTLNVNRMKNTIQQQKSIIDRFEDYYSRNENDNESQSSKENSSE